MTIRNETYWNKKFDYTHLPPDFFDKRPAMLRWRFCGEDIELTEEEAAYVPPIDDKPVILNRGPKHKPSYAEIVTQILVNVSKIDNKLCSVAEALQVMAMIGRPHKSTRTVRASLKQIREQRLFTRTKPKSTEVQTSNPNLLRAVLAVLLRKRRYCTIVETSNILTEVNILHTRGGVRAMLAAIKRDGLLDSNGTPNARCRQAYDALFTKEGKK